MFLKCGGKVYFQYIAFAQTLLNIVYHSHWCVPVGTHAGTHLNCSPSAGLYKLFVYTRIRDFLQHEFSLSCFICFSFVP